jgi:hypothetical protein
MKSLFTNSWIYDAVDSQKQVTEQENKIGRQKRMDDLHTK